MYNRPEIHRFYIGFMHISLKGDTCTILIVCNSKVLCAACDLIKCKCFDLLFVSSVKHRQKSNTKIKIPQKSVKHHES